MSKALAALLGAAIVFSSAATPVAVGSAVIDDSGSNRYKTVRLTPAIYAAADPALGDLRLYDADGDQLPYFIRSGGSTGQTSSHSYPLTQTDSFLKEDAFYLDFAAQTQPNVDLEATALRLTTAAASFAKQVVVRGSYDGTHWEELCTDTIYRVDGAEKLEIPLLGVRSYTHYRLELANNLEQLVFEGAELIYSAASSQSYSFVETLSCTPAVEQQERRTAVTLSGLRNLRLHSITLHTDDMFKRTVTTPQGQKELYRLQLGDTAYTDATLLMHDSVWTEDTLTLTVQNGDDKPLNITGVTVEYLADELVFEGAAAPYRLEFGTGLPAPEYDIARYREQVLTQPLDQLTVGEVTALPQTPPPPADTTNWQLIFNIVLVAVAALLGVLLLTRMRNK